jgi:hypothetical protein
VSNLLKPQPESAALIAGSRLYKGSAPNTRQLNQMDRTMKKKKLDSRVLYLVVRSTPFRK